MIRKAGKFNAEVPIRAADKISGFLKAVSGKITNFQDLLYWSNGKLCESEADYCQRSDMSSIMVLQVPKFENVEEENEEGNTITKSTICIIVPSKEILESANQALFTDDNQPIDTVLKMDATFKLVNNGWLLSPICSEMARFEPPHIAALLV